MKETEFLNEVLTQLTVINERVDELQCKFDDYNEKTLNINQNEDIKNKIKMLLEINKALSSKCDEMELYYLERIDHYMTNYKCSKCSEIEIDRVGCMKKYVNSLTEIKSLKYRIKELEIKNRFYKSLKSEEN